MGVCLSVVDERSAREEKARPIDARKRLSPDADAHAHAHAASSAGAALCLSLSSHNT
jgi:hypothetical protein